MQAVRGVKRLSLPIDICNKKVANALPAFTVGVFGREGVAISLTGGNAEADTLYADLV